MIAHSFGCRVAAWTAVHEPELFGRLILTGAAGIKPIPTEEARKRGEKYRKYKNICESMKKIPVLKKTAEQCEDRLRLKYGSRDYNALDREMQKTFSRIVSQDLKDLYPEIRQSTLLIWGENDTETPLWMGKEMEKRIPDAGLVIFEGGSHFAYLEQIGRFNLIAGQFLKEDM